MSKTISITATKRDTFGSANARRARRAGYIPAVMYGHGKEAASITVTPADAEKIQYHSGLVEITIDGQKQLAIVKDIQSNTISLKIMHIDFQLVKADEYITAEVIVEHQGDAKGIQAGGQLEQVMMAVELKAYPADMPDVLKVDVSGLELDQSIKVKDLVLPEGVSAVSHEDQIVFLCKVPKRAAAAEAAAEAEAASAEAAPAAEPAKK